MGALPDRETQPRSLKSASILGALARRIQQLARISHPVQRSQRNLAPKLRLGAASMEALLPGGEAELRVSGFPNRAWEPDAGRLGASVGRAALRDHLLALIGGVDRNLAGVFQAADD